MRAIAYTVKHTQLKYSDMVVSFPLIGHIGPNIMNKSDGFLSTTLVDKEDLNNGISKSLIQLVDATNGRRTTAVTNHSGKAVIPIQQYITYSNSTNHVNSLKNVQLKYAGDSMYEGSSILLDLGSFKLLMTRIFEIGIILIQFQNTISEFIRTFIMGLSIGVRRLAHYEWNRTKIQ